jgi:hypothetical protein
MWKPKHRLAADRSGVCYPSDFDRLRMDDCGAHDPACEAWRAQPLGECPRGAERDLLHPVDRLPVEGLTQRPDRRRARCTTISNCGTGTAR